MQKEDSDFAELLKLFGLHPTPHQHHALRLFSVYYNQRKTRSAFILKGNAGTGKTTILKSLSTFLRNRKHEIVLLAPTGRAAKVITKKTGRYAATIHRHIYQLQETGGGQPFFFRRPNRDAATTFYIVDEASMIGDEGGANSVLRDFLDFVFEENRSAGLVIVGDGAQLPPVGSQRSPCLDEEYLLKKYRIESTVATMSEVKRQALDSGILMNANKVRLALEAGNFASLRFLPSAGVEVLERPYDALEIFNSEFDIADPDKVIFITFSNRQAVAINQAIRQIRFDDPDELMEGDLVMAVRNNYSYPQKKMTFIANGEMGVVKKFYRESIEENYGLRWADADIEFMDAAGEGIDIKCKIILDLLNSNEAVLSSEKMQRVLHERRLVENPTAVKDKSFRDPYLHALQLKYGYSVTGHKSQGGQWKKVFVAFEPQYPNVTANDYLRWAYTAVTRAEETLYLLGCPFLKEEEAIVAYRNDFHYVPALLKQENFSEEEIALLKEWGPGIVNLLNGKLPAASPGRQRLIRIANNEEQPQQPLDFAMLKYLRVFEEKEAGLQQISEAP